MWDVCLFVSVGLFDCHIVHVLPKFVDAVLSEVHQVIAYFSSGFPKVEDM